MTKKIFIVVVLLLFILGGYYLVRFSASNRQKTEPILPHENIQNSVSSSPEIETPSLVTSSVPIPRPQAICKTTGCSSQICSDKDVTTDCMYREEYICYQKAKCERQQNGKCGWTETEVLKECLLQYE